MVAKVKPDNHKLVIVNPGGGLKGVIQTGILAGAEDWLGARLAEYADLVVASSVGATTATAIGLRVPMVRAQHMIADHKREYFTQNYLKRAVNLYRFAGMYDYRTVLRRLREIGADVALGDLCTQTIITAACRNDGKTHYFKSYDPKDASRRLLDVVSYAFAAPWYFGARNSPAEGRTYYDTGVGIENNPIITALYEIDRLGWDKQGTVNVLIAGTGHLNKWIPYAKTSKEGLAAQLKASIRFASNQAEPASIRVAKFIDSMLERVNMSVADVVIPDGSDSMDEVGYVDTYIDLVNKLVPTLNYSELLGIPE